MQKSLKILLSSITFLGLLACGELPEGSTPQSESASNAENANEENAEDDVIARCKKYTAYASCISKEVFDRKAKNTQDFVDKAMEDKVSRWTTRLGDWAEKGDKARCTTQMANIDQEFGGMPLTAENGWTESADMDGAALHYGCTES